MKRQGVSFRHAVAILQGGAVYGGAMPAGVAQAHTGAAFHEAEAEQ